MIDSADAARLRAPLLGWYRRAKRDLPWRRTKDPYAIWVSEAMLQQTTVAAVIPYWERFLDRFPDLKTLASSREDDVLAAWSGLGYYRRARALRDGAIAVMERHGGSVPRGLDALIALPGIGRYTAGAIASLAFGEEAPVVDGNVKRVFSRLFAIRGGPSAKLERIYWSIATALVSGSTPGDWNQAVMELGATVCTPREPRCDECPLARPCRARALGRPTAFPRREQAAPLRVVPVAVAWIERCSQVLLERRHPNGPFRGDWDLPAAIVPSGVTSGRAIVLAMSARHGLRLRDHGLLLKAKHSILATRLAIEVVEAAPTAPLPRRVALRWVPLGRLSSVPISGATGKIARAVAAQSASGSSGRANA